MAGEFQVSGQNAAALLTLKLHRGDGMTLIAMNWKIGKPPQDFVGFAIEYKEPTGGGGIRMHHKFVVIDFDKPTARVYLSARTTSPRQRTSRTGENLLLIRDRRIAVSYVVEVLRIFDHYHFRVNQQAAKKARKELLLAKPPRSAGEESWWVEDYTDVRKIHDRELFAQELTDLQWLLQSQAECCLTLRETV